jgi:hypothetical protein
MLFFLLAFGGFSQSISGNLRADSTTTLRYGNVDIYKGEKLVASVLTDRLGNFTVALDTGKYVCVFNYAGYYTETKEITVKKDERLDMAMKADASKPKTLASKTDAKIEEVMIVSSGSKHSESRKKTKSLASPPISSPERATAYGRFSDGIDSDAPASLATGTVESRARALTAGEINDFSKWELWQKYTKNELNAFQDSWNIAPAGRYTVLLQSKTGLPLTNALVKLMVANKVVFKSRTDNTGKAELWLTIKKETPSPTGKVSIEVEYAGKTSKISNPQAFDRGMNHLMLEVSCQEIETVDVAFVVDATGSMGDEISYLQAEMTDIMFQSKQISSKLNFRFANVFYRDLGDAYVTQSADFTRVLTESSAFIEAQRAGGGGDYEEAVEIALDSAINHLSWSEEARTRILFLVLDAPPHNTDENRAKMERLIQQAAAKGIRIVPIGASGINKSTEYLLRALAIGTNGTYTFLTNHSGIGNAHLEPTTDKYEVETLNDVMVRILKSYTYMPDCQQQLPDLSLTYPDSIVTNETQQDTIGNDTVPSVKPDTKHIRWNYYPNPTNGLVNLVSDMDIQELYITDLSGKVLQIVKNIEKGRIHIIDLTGYATGIYLIRYPDGENWLSGKVVLQRTS